MHKKTCIHSSTEMSMQYSVSTILSRWAPNTICINHSVTKHIHPVLLTNTAATLQKDRVVPLHSLPKLLDNTHSIHDIICWRKAATFWGTQAIIKQGLCLQCTSASRWGWEAGGREKCENLCSCLYVWGMGWQEKKEKHTNISARSSGWVEDRSNLYLQNCTRVSPFVSYRIWYSRKLDVGKNERKSCNSKTRKVKSSSWVRKKKDRLGKNKPTKLTTDIPAFKKSQFCLFMLAPVFTTFLQHPPQHHKSQGNRAIPSWDSRQMRKLYQWNAWRENLTTGCSPPDYCFQQD